MSSLVILSFVAWILSILAPCILPVLPVILGWSLWTNNLAKPLTIIASTAISITLFTIILKATTALIGIPSYIWTSISAIIIIIYGFILLVPRLREQVSKSLWLYKVNNLTSMAQKHDWVLWNILLWASLWPIFASCSPTYTLLLSTIFPNSFAQWVIYTLIYSIGFALALFAVAYWGRLITQRLSYLANPNSRFKKILGAILIITGILIATWYMKKIEAWFIGQGWVGIGAIEQTLLDSAVMKKDSLSNKTQVTTSWGTQNTSQYLNYNDVNILSLTGDIVLFFHADWCPLCQQAESNFIASGIPAWLTILKVDFDTETQLRTKYAVLTQTTYVYIQSDGTLIKRRIGGTTIDSILKKINDIKVVSTWDTQPIAKTSSNQNAKAYFAWGCFWCMEWPFEAQPWVISAIVWYIGGDKSNANYDSVSQWTTKHKEVVEVSYNPWLISYQELLEIYRNQIDPTDPGGQFTDRWEQYKTAIYVDSPEQKAIATSDKLRVQNSKQYSKPIVVQILPLSTFYPAEEYHQDYYKKNSDAYNKYKKWSWRESFIKGKQPTTVVAIKEAEKPIIISWKDKKPKSTQDLTASQRKILFEWGTETPFDNLYWNNHEAGIYVDVIDGTPLFSSTDKFDSGTWWPSFSRPIDESMVSSNTDTSLGMTRTEIKSSSSNGHLWHIFDDGPVESWWTRYCINSAALEFVPVTQLESKWYGEYMRLFK